MPKERHHLLLAESALTAAGASLRLVISDKHSRFAYLLGSISPDTLFYDLPSFTLTAVGRSFHRYQGDAGAAFFYTWLTEEAARIPPVVQAWMLGFVSHLLADGIWHPHIQVFSTSESARCNQYQLSPGDCHHWLESELEAFWLDAMGPKDGYIPLLRSICKEMDLTAPCIEWYRRFLERVGIEQIPAAKHIRRCLCRQTLLLRLFAHPALARYKTGLLRWPQTRYIGALIVPIQTRSDSRNPNPPIESGPGGRLFQKEFMAEAIMRLGRRLIELPVQL